VTGRTIRELRGSLGPREQGLIITTSGFTKDASSEAEIADRAPIALISGTQLVDLLAENALGLRRRESVVLEIDEEVLAGKVADGTEEAEGSSTGAAYRGLWPLPGGARSYATTMRVLLGLLHDQPPVEEFIGRLQSRFPKVASKKTANGYLRVLVALGSAKIEGGRVAITPQGRAFAETGDITIAQKALRERIVGVEEVLRAITEHPRSAQELRDVLAAVGLTWETDAQLRFRMQWLESTGLVQLRNGRYEPVSAPG